MAKMFWLALSLLISLTVLNYCSEDPLQYQSLRPTPNINEGADSVRFAIIGDYGFGLQPEKDVADLVKSWNPDIIITTGDNNLPTGSASTVDANIGQFYHDYIFPYVGEYGEGADMNRFFPTLGNHDYDCGTCPQPYLDYFALPGNERYYEVILGPVHLFAINSNEQEPDGIDSGSVQAQWLKFGLATSTKAFKFVYMHHPPYTSGIYGTASIMQWPFKEWGADAIFAGNDHLYERIVIDDLPYFINGLGGAMISQFSDIAEGSEVRYNEDHGAMLVEVIRGRAIFQFITRSGELIDTYELDYSSIY